MEGAHCLWKGAIVADLSQLLMTQKTSPLLSYQTNKSGRQYKSSVGIYLRTPCIHLCPCLGTESCARSDLLTNFGLSLESKSWEDRLFGALVGIYWDGVVGWVEVLGNLQGGGEEGESINSSFRSVSVSVPKDGLHHVCRSDHQLDRLLQRHRRRRRQLVVVVLLLLVLQPRPGRGGRELQVLDPRGDALRCRRRRDDRKPGECLPDLFLTLSPLFRNLPFIGAQLPWCLPE